MSDVVWNRNIPLVYNNKRGRKDNYTPDNKREKSSCILKDKNFCELGECIKSIKALEPNSGSPSEFWFVQFVDDVRLDSSKNSEVIKYGFIKLFLSLNTVEYMEKLKIKYGEYLKQRENAAGEWNRYISSNKDGITQFSDSNKKEQLLEYEKIKRKKEKFNKYKKSDTILESTYGLDYESEVYKRIRDKILVPKISPNFVRILGAAPECSIDNIVGFFEKMKIDTNEVKNRIKYNLIMLTMGEIIRYFMYEELLNTPPKDRTEMLNQCCNWSDIDTPLNDTQREILENFTNFFSDIQRNKIEDLTVGYICTDRVPDGSIKLGEWFATTKKVINEETGEDVIGENGKPLYNSIIPPVLEEHATKNKIWKIIFQVVYGIAAMVSVDIIHNDLHLDNIWLVPYNNKDVYTVNNKNYLMDIDWQVRIFDFDRSTIRGEPNRILEQDWIQEYSQSNDFIPNKDIAKLFGDLLFEIQSTPEEIYNGDLLFKNNLLQSTPKEIYKGILKQKKKKRLVERVYNNGPYLQDINSDGKLKAATQDFYDAFKSPTEILEWIATTMTQNNTGDELQTDTDLNKYTGRIYSLDRSHATDEIAYPLDGSHDIDIQLNHFEPTNEPDKKSFLQWLKTKIKK